MRESSFSDYRISALRIQYFQLSLCILLAWGGLRRCCSGGDGWRRPALVHYFHHSVLGLLTLAKIYQNKINVSLSRFDSRNAIKRQFWGILEGLGVTRSVFSFSFFFFFGKRDLEVPTLWLKSNQAIQHRTLTNESGGDCCCYLWCNSALLPSLFWPSQRCRKSLPSPGYHSWDLWSRCKRLPVIWKVWHIHQQPW